jgi:hypothetical protein
MSTRFDSLGDHGVDARRRCGLCLLDGSDLDEHREPERVRLVDERRRVAPEQHDRGRACLCRSAELREEDRSILLDVHIGVVRDDDVDPERPVCQSPGSLDLAPERVRRHAARPEDAEPACVGNGSDELRAGACANPGGENGIVDSEQPAKRRSQRGHASIICAQELRR